MSLPFVPRPSAASNLDPAGDAAAKSGASKPSPFGRAAAGLRKLSPFASIAAQAPTAPPAAQAAEPQMHEFNIRSVEDAEDDGGHGPANGVDEAAGVSAGAASQAGGAERSSAPAAQPSALSGSPFAKLFANRPAGAVEARPVAEASAKPGAQEVAPAGAPQDDPAAPNPSEVGSAIDALYKGDASAVERSYAGTKAWEDSPFAGRIDRSSMPHVKQLYMDLRGMKTLTQIAGAVIERPGSNAPDGEKIDAVLRILGAAREAGLELAEAVTSARDEKLNAWASSMGVDAVTSAVVARWKAFKDENVDDVIDLVRSWVEESVRQPERFEQALESLNAIAAKPRIEPDRVPHDRLRMSLRVAHLRFLEVYGVEAKTLPSDEVEVLLRGCIDIAANAAVRIDDRELAITYFQSGLGRAVSLAAAEYRRARKLADVAHPGSAQAEVSLPNIIKLVRQDMDSIEASVDSTLRSFEKREFHATRKEREAR